MININKYRAIKKKREMNKSASVPMQKLHMEMDDRGRPKIKVDNKYTPKPMRMTDMTPAMPYNNPKPHER